MHYSRVLLILILVGFGVISSLGFSLGYKTARVRSERLLREYSGVHEEIKVVRNEKRRVDALLQDAIAENTQLRDLIASLRERPEKIKTVVETVTVLKPSEETSTVSSSQEYLYRLKPGLVVARFNRDSDNNYEFTTYALSFYTDILVADRDAALILRASSSYDDTIYELPKESVHVKVTTVDDHRVIEPHLSLGITGAIPDPKIQASVITSLVHPTEYLDIASLAVNVNNENLSIGVLPVSYNIGKHIPLFQDTWLSPGIALGPNAQLQASVTLSTKF